MALAAAGPHNGEDFLLGLKSSDSRVVCRTLATIADLGEGGAASLGYGPDVAALTRHADEMVALAAAEAIGQMGAAGLQHMDALARLLAGPGSKRRTFAVGALGLLGEAAGAHVGSIAALLEDPDPSLRASCCVALGSMHASTEVEKVARCLSDSHPAVVRGAITALALLDTGALAKQVAEKLTDTSRDVRIAAILYFGKFEDAVPQHRDAVCAALRDKDANVRAAAVTLFGTLKDPRRPRPWCRASPHCWGTRSPAPGPLRRWPSAGSAAPPRRGPRMSRACCWTSPRTIAAACALGDLGTGPVDEVAALLDEPSAPVKAAAATACGKLTASAPEADVAARVSALLTDTSPAVRAAALGALRLMGDEGAVFTDTFKGMFADRSRAVRAAAIRAFGGVGLKGQCYAPDICRCIYDGDADIRAAALEIGQGGSGQRPPPAGTQQRRV
ncbi:unnamed protein product [Prorocentrum cordatum]|uniref:HEAT repeat domain-containing protein n=1 Tax=Prorocentrum cordatum TaxID=2364126 RepID=A0ABN9RN49_9DINO|nr:unnamed protein product [Polarella glacialis]